MRQLLVTLGLVVLIGVAACGGDSVPDELKNVCTQGDNAATDAIKITAPGNGAEVTSPLHVTGTINVAESQFFIAIVGGDGTHISDYPGRAGQTGIAVPFQQDVPFGVEQKTPACLWVSQHNEADPQDAIRVPITLMPGGSP